MSGIALVILLLGVIVATLAPDVERALSGPHTKKGRLQRAAYALLLEHQRDEALPTSIRFLFYEAEQRGILSKQKKGARRADQDLTDAVMWLRDKGIIRFDWIVDETRQVTSWKYADTVQDYLRDAAEHARIDCWDGESPPLILCESRSLAGVLRPIAATYLCPIAGDGRTSPARESHG